MEDGKELRFHLQQMSAFDFEHWLACLNQLLRNAGRDTPASQEVRPVTEFFLNKDSNSPTKVTIIGKAKTALDLMEEMLLCAAYVDDQGQHIPLTQDVAEHVIGQITPLLELRGEILRLNLDWALADVKSTRPWSRSSCPKRRVTCRPAAGARQAALWWACVKLWPCRAWPAWMN